MNSKPKHSSGASKMTFRTLPGSSVRSIEHITGTHRDTIMRLGVLRAVNLAAEGHAAPSQRDGQDEGAARNWVVVKRTQEGLSVHAFARAFWSSAIMF